jgi:hypothetical protein
VSTAVQTPDENSKSVLPLFSCGKSDICHIEAGMYLFPIA